ncbi:MAG: hypothetical protein QJR03_07725 [Sphaerobacter sp.]|nr:hypothetical protein [Sphaerobacter sp.]
MRNPLSWDYLNAPLYDTPVWGPFSIAFVALCSVGFVASLLAYYDAGRWLSRRYPIAYRTIQRATGISSVLFGLGLFFFTFRFLHVSAWGLYKRFWLYLVLLALLAEAGYYLWWARTVYPAKVRAHAAEQLKRRYLEPALAGGPRRRGGKRRKR